MIIKRLEPSGNYIYHPVYCILVVIFYLCVCYVCDSEHQLCFYTYELINVCVGHERLFGVR